MGYNKAMQGEENTPAEVGLLGRFDAIQKRLETDPEFSRRTLLKGMGAFSVLTALQGMASVNILRSREALDMSAGDICPDYEIECYLQEAGLDVPAAQAEPTAAVPEAVFTSETVPPAPVVAPETTTTALPPPPPPAPAPPPPPVPVAAEVMASSANLEPAPRRNMSYAEFAANAELFFARLPSIDALAATFPGTAFFQMIPEQRQHIEDLRASVQPTPEKYHAFGYNTSCSQTFNQTEPLAPQAVIWHWTGWDYAQPADLHTMRPNSVQMYVHHDAVAYQMVPDLDVVAGHARTLNPFAWGIEMHSGQYDEVHSPLFNFTPGEVETGVYAAVNRLRSRNLPVGRNTILGHFTGDLIFMNPYYDPYTGTFHEVPGYKSPHIHKFDPPQEFMDMVVQKAIELDTALGPR